MGVSGAVHSFPCTHYTLLHILSPFRSPHIRFGMALPRRSEALARSWQLSRQSTELLGEISHLTTAHLSISHQQILVTGFSRDCTTSDLQSQLHWAGTPVLELLHLTSSSFRHQQVLVTGLFSRLYDTGSAISVALGRHSPEALCT